MYPKGFQDQIFPYRQQHGQRPLLSGPDQRLYNERNTNLLEGAISFWEATPEAQRLNGAFAAAQGQLPPSITKIFAFGLPDLLNLSELRKTEAQVKFEDLDETQRLPYVLHAALISLKKTLSTLTDDTVEIELHSMEYQTATERFLKTRHLQAHASHSSPELLEELANRVSEQTVVFAPRTKQCFKLYIQAKAKEWPGVVVWDPTEAEGLDAEMRCYGSVDRWCSVYDMVTRVYDEVLRADAGYLGPYEVCIKKPDQRLGLPDQRAP